MFTDLFELERFALNPNLSDVVLFKIKLFIWIQNRTLRFSSKNIILS